MDLVTTGPSTDGRDDGDGTAALPIRGPQPNTQRVPAQPGAARYAPQDEL